MELLAEWYHWPNGIKGNIILLVKLRLAETRLAETRLAEWFTIIARTIYLLMCCPKKKKNIVFYFPKINNRVNLFSGTNRLKFDQSCFGQSCNSYYRNSSYLNSTNRHSDNLNPANRSTTILCRMFKQINNINIDCVFLSSPIDIYLVYSSKRKFNMYVYVCSVSINLS